MQRGAGHLTAEILDDDDDDADFCPESPDGEHTIDPFTVHIAIGISNVVDFNCRFCGRSGAAPTEDDGDFEEEDVQW